MAADPRKFACWRACSLALLVCVAGPALAQGDTCYERAQTQGDLIECATEALKRADSELNAAYREMLARLADDKTAQAALTQAQRSWFDFRDAECRFATLRTQGSDLHVMQANECRARIARNRAADLEEHLACAATAPDEEARGECAVPGRYAPAPRTPVPNTPEPTLPAPAD